MRGLILSAGISALLLGSTQAGDYWGNCTRSTNISPELRIRDCTDRITKRSVLFLRVKH